MSIAEIADFVVKNNEINFVGFAITPWHLLGVESCISYLRNDVGLCINPGLVIMKHKQTGYALNENDIKDKQFSFVIKHNEIYTARKEILRFFQYIRFFLSRKKTFDNIFIASPAKLHLMFGNEIFRKTNKRIKFIITDEGCAQHMGTLYNGGNVGKKIRIYRLINRFFNYIFLKRNNVLHHTLLLPSKKEKFIVNQQVANSYLRIMKKKYSENIYSFNEKSVLLCTTAWQRNNILDDEDEVCLRKVVNLCKNAGYKIYLKTHPRDRYFEKIALDICDELLETCVPIEVLYCQNKLPKIIISYSSTVLVTAKIFTKIQPICLTSLLNRTKISSFYLNEIDAFKKAFDGFVYFPTNFDDVVANSHI